MFLSFPHCIFGKGKGEGNTGGCERAGVSLAS